MAGTDNLIESWLAVELACPGSTAAAALRSLNEACGKRYTHAQLSEWRRGIKAPSVCAQRYMLAVAIGRVLQPIAGPLDDDDLQPIIDALSLPATD